LGFETLGLGLALFLVCKTFCLKFSSVRLEEDIVLVDPLLDALDAFDLALGCLDRLLPRQFSVKNEVFAVSYYVLTETGPFDLTFKEGLLSILLFLLQSRHSFLHLLEPLSEIFILRGFLVFLLTLV
jgi:hypothetical protein